MTHPSDSAPSVSKPTDDARDLPPLPTPVLYVHELVQNRGGVWLGCADLNVVIQAHDPGETGDEILPLFTADQMHEFARAARAIGEKA